MEMKKSAITQEQIAEMVTSDSSQQRMMGRLLATGIMDTLSAFTKAESAKDSFEAGDYVIALLRLLGPSISFVLMHVDKSKRQVGLNAIVDDFKAMLEQSLEISSSTFEDEDGEIRNFDSAEDALDYVKSLIEAEREKRKGKLN